MPSRLPIFYHIGHAVSQSPNPLSFTTTPPISRSAAMSNLTSIQFCFTFRDGDGCGWVTPVPFIYINSHPKKKKKKGRCRKFSYTLIPFIYMNSHPHKKINKRRSQAQTCPTPFKFFFQFCTFKILNCIKNK